MDLETAYAYPPGRWLRANMVVSVDGAAALDGHSEKLSGAADKRVFGTLRALCDAIVVGAGTARAEGYAQVRIGPRRAEIRARLGLSVAPPVVVISRSLDLDLRGPLFGEAQARTIVVTSSADPERLRSARAVADVVAVDGSINLGTLLDQLADRGLSRLLCEGGPCLLADLIDAGLLDELCLTVSPLLVGTNERRLVPTLARPASLDLAGSFAEDGFLFLRYLLGQDSPSRSSSRSPSPAIS